MFEIGYLFGWIRATFMRDPRAFPPRALQPFFTGSALPWLFRFSEIELDLVAAQLVLLLFELYLIDDPAHGILAEQFEHSDPGIVGVLLRRSAVLALEFEIPFGGRFGDGGGVVRDVGLDARLLGRRCDRCGLASDIVGFEIEQRVDRFVHPNPPFALPCRGIVPATRAQPNGLRKASACGFQRDAPASARRAAMPLTAFGSGFVHRMLAARYMGVIR